MPPLPAGRAATSLRCGLRALAAAALAAFLSYLIFCQSDSYKAFLDERKSSWVILYDYGAALGIVNLDARGSTVMLFLWLTLLASALLTLAYRNIPTPHCPHTKPRLARLRAKARQALAYELPPRPFWSSWCGGMSVGDALLVLFWLGVNAWYLGAYMEGYMQRINAAFDVGVAMPYAKSVYVLERLALTFGWMMNPNLVLLFLPIPHSSFLNILTGIPHEGMIRYHRWLGHGTMWVLTLHGTLYYLYWIITGDFWAEFSDWGMMHGVNNLAGSLAFFCGLVLWGTATSWCRRKFYEVFYRCHILCFVGFFVFAHIHYSFVWMYFLPGLLLYAIDLVLRSGQLANVTTVTAADVKPGGELATLQLQAGQGISACPLREVYLLFPNISRWQWHPFTIAGHGPDGTLSLHIKRYGSFTQKLIQKLSAGEPLPVRASGPVGNDAGSRSWEGCPSLLLIGGGVGATPLLSILRDLISRRRAGAALAAQRVHFVWACRHPEEFTTLDEGLLAAASEASGWLTLSLHHTGPSPLKAKALGSPTVSTLKAASSGSLKPGSDSGDSLAALAPTYFPSASPYFWSLARRIQPKVLNDLHYAAIHVLVFFGAFCALYLGYAFSAEYNTYWASVGARPSGFAWKVGLVWSLAQPVVSLGLPFLLAVFPVHMWRYWKARQAVRNGLENAAAAELVAPYTSQEELAARECVLRGSKLVLPGSDLEADIVEGRPDLSSALCAAGAGADTVGVYVGGPQPLRQAVQLMVSELNGQKGAPCFYSLHNEASEL